MLEKLIVKLKSIYFLIHRKKENKLLILNQKFINKKKL